MITILYVVSTLAPSGPTNQLLNLTRHLDGSRFSPLVLTLSPEIEGTMRPAFEATGVEVLTLGMSRMAWLLKGRRELVGHLNRLSPDIVHTQGIRADMALAALGFRSWIATARNYPLHDYPMKFGPVRGNLMARQHLRALGKCSHRVSCSRSIAEQLSKHGMASVTIQNGVELREADIRALPEEMSRPIFVTVGSLIERKNTAALVSAFKQYAQNNNGSFVVLGDGPECRELEEAATGYSIHFLGKVPDVADHLRASDCFLSASRSEGLPNAVLEAFAAGIPALLSDIPSHREIHIDAPGTCRLFPLSNDVLPLVQLMEQVANGKLFNDASQALAQAAQSFSASRMSQEYQALYEQVAQR